MDSVFFDFESEDDEVDEISQIMIRQQLSQLLIEDFVLPGHIKFSTVAFEQQHENLRAPYYHNDYYFDNFLDEQEEIKLMESPSLVEIPGEVDTLSQSFDYSPKLNTSTDIEILDDTQVAAKLKGSIQSSQRRVNEKTLKEIPVPDSQKWQPITNSDLKRRRRPTMNFDDFVYIPLTKVRMASSDTDVKVMTKKEKPKNAAIKLMESPSLLEIPGEMDTPSHSFNYSPKLNSSTDIEILDDTQVAAKLKKAVQSSQRRKTLKEIPIPDSLKCQPITKNSDLKRRRRPTKNFDDFVYIPLTKMRMASSDTEVKVIAKKEKPKNAAAVIVVPLATKSRMAFKKKSDKVTVKRMKKDKERSEKQLQRLELITRMTQLRHLNPLARAMRGMCLYEGDYFYREILVSRPDSCANDELEVDCVTVNAPGGFDELFVTNPAESCANSINKMLFGKNVALSSVHNQEGDGISKSESINSLGAEVRTYLDIFLKFIDDQRLVDLATQGVAGGASMFHSLTMKNANRLRESLRLYNKSGQSLIVRVHGWLLKNLGQTRLISYLNLLRFLKNAGSNLSEYIIASSSEQLELERANKNISEFLAQKLYEPPLSSSSKLIECDPIKNVSLVLVYPQINAKPSQHTIRAHETLFRNLLPLAVCCVEKIELNLNVDRPISVEECTWMCIRLIRQRVKEIAKRRQNDHIFLAGWGTTCWLNHKVVSKVSNVSGLLDFAFPTESPCGSRGSVDDQICLTYPSTLFVVGEDAHNVRMQALRQLRKNMIADSGLVVIGNANHNLQVSPTMLSIERVSQFIIQKNIVVIKGHRSIRLTDNAPPTLKEYVMQFIKQVVTDLGPPKECRQFLKPIKLPNIYEVDPAFFKAKQTTGPNRPRKTMEKKERNEKGDQLIRKERKVPSDHFQKMPFRHPTQIALNLPTQLQPAIPTASSKYGTNLYSARHSFSISLKTAESKIADPLKIPSPETLNRQLPALLQGRRVTMAPSSSNAFQDTLREEEEAAAALASLK